MDKSLWKIEALTNIHAGNGDLSYGIIDNQVQRDLVTGYPAIYGSSLKGSLRAHMSRELEKNQVEKIFGGEGQDNVKQGDYRFFDANLLAFPIRSTKKAYFYGVSYSLIDNLSEMIEKFGIKASETNMASSLDKFKNELKNGLNESLGKERKDKIVLISGKADEYKDQQIEVEDQEVEAYVNWDEIPSLEILKTWIGDEILLLPDDKFKEIIDELPVIARNNLENGISKNLWYEEMVPKKTLFNTFLLNEDREAKNEAIFEEKLGTDVIQIGANASVGCGYTSFERMSGGEKSE